MSPWNPRRRRRGAERATRVADRRAEPRAPTLCLAPARDEMRRCEGAADGPGRRPPPGRLPRPAMGSQSPALDRIALSVSRAPPGSPGVRSAARARSAPSAPGRSGARRGGARALDVFIRAGGRRPGTVRRARAPAAMRPGPDGGPANPGKDLRFMHDGDRPGAGTHLPPALDAATREAARDTEYQWTANPRDRRVSRPGPDRAGRGDGGPWGFPDGRGARTVLRQNASVSSDRRAQDPSGSSVFSWRVAVATPASLPGASGWCNLSNDAGWLASCG